jgi:hypothetical protein
LTVDEVDRKAARERLLLKQWCVVVRAIQNLTRDEQTRVLKASVALLGLYIGD